MTLNERTPLKYCPKNEIPLLITCTQLFINRKKHFFSPTGTGGISNDGHGATDQAQTNPERAATVGGCSTHNNGDR